MLGNLFKGHIYEVLMNKIENETHHRQMRNELLLVVIPRPMNSPSVKQTAILTPIFQRVRLKYVRVRRTVKNGQQ